ncbi:exo-alpha-sialidase [Hyphobacterium sp. CCMP332]|nr:exo-alpha-sialidase [Hyphobacterium sp. CCMP332]
MKYLTLIALAAMLACKSSDIVLLEKQSALKGHNPCEPSISINPINPKNIVAGAIIDRYYYSKDGGKKWKSGKLKSSYGVFGDPVIVADYKGNFYYLHLSDPSGKNWRSDELLDRIVCQKSTDGGVTFDNGTFMGLNSPKDQDKHWAVVDPKTNNIYVTWTQFDEYKSIDPNDKSNILFSKSTDAGATWSEAIRINQKSGNCLDDDQTTEGAVPAVGPNGEIYVSWSYNDTIWFDKSTDGGKTWLENDIVVVNQVGGWDMDIPGIMRCNGMPITLCDLSDGQNSGSIYINYADQKNGITDTDVWLVKSEDKGETWSNPIKVNRDSSGNHQFFTWMAIDQNDGNLYAVFYDRRNFTSTETEVFLAWSKDGGETFFNKKINEESFVPNPIVFFGDYNNISAHDGVIAPIWTEAQGLQTGVYTRIIKKEELEDQK